MALLDLQNMETSNHMGLIEPSNQSNNCGSYKSYALC